MWAKSYVSSVFCVSLSSLFNDVVSCCDYIYSSGGDRRRRMNCGWNETDTAKPYFMERKKSRCRSVHSKLYTNWSVTKLRHSR